MVNKILIVKNETQIVISNNGKRLVIKSDNKLFNTLQEKSKEEIQKWYLEERFL